MVLRVRDDAADARWCCGCMMVLRVCDGAACVRDGVCKPSCPQYSVLFVFVNSQFKYSLQWHLNKTLWLSIRKMYLASDSKYLRISPPLNYSRYGKKYARVFTNITKIFFIPYVPV